MAEWIKLLGVAGLTAILGWLAKQYNWIRLRPKEAAEAKVEEQKVEIGQIDNSVKLNNIAVDYTNFIMVRLKRVEEQLTDEEKHSEALRLAVMEKDAINHALKDEIGSIKEKFKQLGQELNDCLKMGNCDEAIKKIIIKYGLD